ncbi:MAG: hypothetical protein AAGM38_02460 [Pseudomonadota bacterium]
MTPLSAVERASLRGRIAVLGWGSLIWDSDGFDAALEPGWTGGARAAPSAEQAGLWACGAGPVLPLEFSRISRKRPGALTLVIDPEAGAPCVTAVAISVRRAVDEAAADLARRERAPLSAIGCWAPGDAATRSAIADWARAHDCAGVVWTALSSSFAERAGAPFSIEAARRHLQALDDDALRAAALYIERAPRETDTPLRRALAADPWWRETLGRLL